MSISIDEYLKKSNKVIVDAIDALDKSIGYKTGIDAKNDEAFRALVIANNSALDLILWVEDHITAEVTKNTSTVLSEDLIKEVNGEA